MKKLLVLFLVVLLTLSFVACGKNKDSSDDDSSLDSSSKVDNTQDFLTEFNNSDLTSSEEEELRDWWNQTEGTIEVDSSKEESSKVDSSTDESITDNSSVDSSSSDSSEVDSSDVSSSEEGDSIGGDRDGWFDFWV